MKLYVKMEMESCQISRCNSNEPATKLSLDVYDDDGVDGGWVLLSTPPQPICTLRGCTLAPKAFSTLRGYLLTLEEGVGHE